MVARDFIQRRSYAWSRLTITTIYVKTLTTHLRHLEYFGGNIEL
jgi:hypothetical protein